MLITRLEHLVVTLEGFFRQGPLRCPAGDGARHLGSLACQSGPCGITAVETAQVTQGIGSYVTRSATVSRRESTKKAVVATAARNRKNVGSANSDQGQGYGFSAEEVAVVEAVGGALAKESIKAATARPNFEVGVGANERTHENTGNGVYGRSGREV